jgi:glucose-1-phosphate cytidylyltransferase
MPNSDVPVFLLAGGLGTRLKEQTEFRPKPMVDIGGKPILWHIMRWYSSFGFRRFVICAGFKSEIIKDYFANYPARSSDFTVNLRTRDVVYHNMHHDEDWVVTVAYTGESAMTGARIKKAAETYLGDAKEFAVSYGDGLTDADLSAELAFHRSHGRMGTVLAVNPPSRFGELMASGDTVERFSEKPDLASSWINGGYFFFRRDFLKYLPSGDACVLEREPLVNLAQDRQLMLFRHSAFWACMDTQRDRDELEALWGGGSAPWIPKQR